jgi:DNA-binding Lrp family transcriptional regulator
MPSERRSSGPRPLDDVDRRLLVELQVDARVSVNELAARVNIARATAYQRLQRLEQDGVITRYTAVVDPARVGLGVAALILVNVDQGDWRDARQRLLDLPGLQYLAVTSGTFDFAALVRVPDVETLRDVVLLELHGLPEVKSTQTVFVLEDHLPLAVVPPEAPVSRPAVAARGAAPAQAAGRDASSRQRAR